MKRWTLENELEKVMTKRSTKKCENWKLQRRSGMGGLFVSEAVTALFACIRGKTSYVNAVSLTQLVRQRLKPLELSLIAADSI